jgi:hypothetical protein
MPLSTVTSLDTSQYVINSSRIGNIIGLIFAHGRILEDMVPSGEAGLLGKQ